MVSAARLTFFFPIERTLRFDCLSNEWNYSELFDFKENVSGNPEWADDELGEWEEFMALEEGQMQDSHSPLEDSQIDDPTDHDTPMDVSYPPLDFGAIFLALDVQHSPCSELIDAWMCGVDFAQKHWGLVLSGQTENIPATISQALGLHENMDDLAVKRLFQAVTKASSVVPSDCDLSPEHPYEDTMFLQPSQNTLHIEPVSKEAYLVTVSHPAPKFWKILIEDPIILLRIYREGWHSDPDHLVSNMIRKGLPFKILYPYCQEGSVFHPHGGPVLHPPAKLPTVPDYLAYRLDLVDFFKLYPHAHVAALCSGNIFWRLAIDILPIPEEYNIIRPFHPSCCDTFVFPGSGNYWTPRLNDDDEEMIAGVYRRSGKSSLQRRRRPANKS